MARHISSNTIVLEVLKDDNYGNWSVYMKNYLLAQDLWDVVETTTEPPNEDVGDDFKAWRKKNAAALHAIQISCSPNIFFYIKNIAYAKISWDTLAEMNTPQSPQEAQNNGYHQFQPLHKAVEKGDWEAAKNFLKLNPNAINAKISSTGKTALHSAAFAGHTKIVKELVEIMSEEDLELRDEFGDTALTLASYNGITEIAEHMIKKNKNLACIASSQGKIPLQISCLAGHKHMTHYFYSVTPIEFLSLENNTHGALFLVGCILCQMFDLALDLLKRCPHLAFAKTKRAATPIYVLSLMPAAFPSGSRLVFWQRWIYSCIRIQLPSNSNNFCINIPQKSQSEQNNVVAQVLAQLRGLVSGLIKFSGMKKIYDVKLMHIQALELLRCMCKEISTFDAPQLMQGQVYDTILEATKHGIFEIVIETIKANPDLIWTKDTSSSRDIFQCAIEYRQEKIFSLIYGLDARRDAFVTFVDSYQNTMLHLAGLLTPSSQLTRISGAALQMQRDLQWFKEVESIVRPTCKEDINDNREKPRQVFTRNHKDLLKEGERWMKEMATSSTVVGALIITVMFAAAFTVPGGNNQDTGLPIFLHEKSFMIFIISDAISLFSSATSVLIFLGMLTSRYAEDDFLISLPTKLIIGLSTLFFSIAAMMVAFCAALFIMLDRKFHILIPIMLLASVPVTLFVSLQFPLLIDIFSSTYGSGIFDRKMRWL